MSALITFRGVALLNTDEGTYQFKPGSIGRDIQTVKLARSTGLLFKDLGTSGAVHSLSLVFCVATASVATIRARVQAACTAVDGTLVIPGYAAGEFPNCVITGKPDWGQQQPITLGASTAGYRMPCTLTFTQLR